MSNQRKSQRWLGLLHCAAGLALISTGTAFAAEPVANTEQIHAAITRSLTLLERGAKTSRAARSECFTCHNQGLPIMALTTARRKGFLIDEAELKAELQFTADFLAKNREGYQQGRGQAGKTFMAGYALWALQYGDWKPDETTAAVAEFFLQFQSDQSHWSAHTNRPPSEASDFTANFLGLVSLQSFSTPDQQERVTTRTAQVREWLRITKPVDTEDRVFRLWGLRLAAADEAEIQAAATELRASQHADGGWSQTEMLESDAYATGTALVALHRAGNLPTDADSYRRGVDWLLQAQRDDGSWHVVSRSEPFQDYYESGYPHGDDQFISITAGGWATLALLAMMPDVNVP